MNKAYEELQDELHMCHEHLSAALEREQALAAHLEDCIRLCREDHCCPSEHLNNVAREIASKLRNPSLATKRDLIKQAEALEEEANGWPTDKYTECSHVRESILHSAEQLRQQAENQDD